MTHEAHLGPRPVRPRGRRKRLIWLLLLALVAAGLIVRAAVDVWAGRRLAEEIQRLTLAYGAFGTGGDLRRAQQSPQGRNLARVMGAAALLAGDTREGFARALKELATPADARVPEDLQGFHAANLEAIRLAVAGRQHTHTDWTSAVGADDRMLPLRDLSTLAAALRADSRVSLAHGRPDDAAAATSAGLALATSLRNESPLVPQLVRIAITTGQLVSMRDLQALAEPSEPALAELAEKLRVSRAHDPIRTGMIGDLRHTDAALARMEAGESAGLFAGGGSASLTGWWTGPLLRFGRPLIRVARLRLLRVADRVIALQASPPAVSPREAIVANAFRSWCWRWLPPVWGWRRAVEAGDWMRAESNAAGGGRGRDK